MIELKKVYKEYKVNKNKIIEALNEIDLQIKDGEYITIIGKSGSGKSTLLNVIGGLDKVTGGNYYYRGKEVIQKNKELSDFRYNNVGIIVQNYALINYRSVFYNISLPLIYKGMRKDEINESVIKWADYLGVSDKLNCLPTQLSGGQCQRVAIARALCKNPKILLADEPTGALDYENKKNVIEILKKLNKQGITIIVATHDYEVANQSGRVIKLNNGKIV